MRHVIFAHPVAARSRRMIEAAATARLVTATGFALRAPARFPGASLRLPQCRHPVRLLARLPQMVRETDLVDALFWGGKGGDALASLSGQRSDLALAQRDERVVYERVIDEVDRHGAGHCTWNPSRVVRRLRQVAS